MSWEAMGGVGGHPPPHPAAAPWLTFHMWAGFFDGVLSGQIWPMSSPTSVIVPVKWVVRMKPVTVEVSAF